MLIALYTDLTLVDALLYEETLRDAGIESIHEEYGLSGVFNDARVAGSRNTVSGAVRLLVDESAAGTARSLIDPLRKGRKT